MVQWLGLHASTAGGSGSIPGLGTKILQDAWPPQNVNFLQKEQKKLFFITDK